MFVHGLFDTSLGWLANGAASSPIAAWKAGCDVWIIDSRANPPWDHVRALRTQIPELAIVMLELFPVPDQLQASTCDPANSAGHRSTSTTASQAHM